MTPLQTILETIQKLVTKPLDFYGIQEQEIILKNTLSAINSLKQALESKNLTTTHAHKAIKKTEMVLLEKIDEVEFIQALGNVIDIYSNTPPPNIHVEELLEKINKIFTKTKTAIIEHHVLLEKLEDRTKKLSPEEQEKNDKETIQKIGIFYVLEYTLQVLHEFTCLDDNSKQKLLTTGLQTKAGNLPAYYPLENTFRKELCYKIFNPEIRHQLLAAFYKLEEDFYSEDLKKVFLALKEFNLNILETFSKFGLKKFQGMLYKPFGDSLPVSELIKKIKELK
ncbi:MAG: hypothetical protein US42_C0010G0032 [Candidatus Magasanikbacteria bacterium GW2011_GWC2_37_14]|uniref:Uncharacterized protein n=1 Tax=Candidatus Magasanikbacteria bacterium GW2011_GWC2_37_14 TaxID=1619046 RepID=A0A0G0GMJ9_9BACT|nr:MAG: hypothetical protein US42_C0010G0032 [Candidatus Magasanikbacteria bacterium GW2011_GWC2_37_14]